MRTPFWNRSLMLLGAQGGMVVIPSEKDSDTNVITIRDIYIYNILVGGLEHFYFPYNMG